MNGGTFASSGRDHARKIPARVSLPQPWQKEAQPTPKAIDTADGRDHQ
jgi:hypothetical protein